MSSFQEFYCSKNRCGADQFSRKVFYESLYRHTIAFVPLFGGFGADYFAPDRELVAGVGRASNLAQVRTEIGDYFMNSGNRGWLRHRLKLRVSTSRLRRLATRYLAGAESRSSGGEIKHD